MPIKGESNLRVASPTAPDLRALLNEVVVNFHDYIGQTVYGNDWVKRARAALKENRE